MNDLECAILVLCFLVIYGATVFMIIGFVRVGTGRRHERQADLDTADGCDRDGGR